jgi:hypothetical protein
LSLILRYPNGRQEQKFYELDENETLPHRPDAFFTLLIHQEGSDPRRSSFFYEADRKTTNTTRFIKKLRAHFYYIIRQRLHNEHYGTSRIRAVLTETLDKNWAENLREAARHQLVSGNTPSPLFWFTASENFTTSVEIYEGKNVKRIRSVPRFLVTPKLILE